MRQIQIGALFFMLAASCGGEQFTSGGDDFARSSDGSQSAAPPSNGQAGEDTATAASGGRMGTSGSSPGKGGDLPSAAGSAGNVGGAISSGNTGGASNGFGGIRSDCSGTVKIRMVPDPELPKQFLCDAGCGTGWLTITKANGAAAFSLFSGCGTISCETCSATPCAAAACQPTPLTPNGNELVWTGTYLTRDTCGSSQACEKPACVPAGLYKAKACASLNGGTSEAGSCMAKADQVCAEAEFEFPADTEVTLVLKK